MRTEFGKIADGYLYSVWTGQIEEFKGEIYHRDEYTHEGKWYPSRTRFIAYDKYGRRTKSYDCSNVEGEFYNKVVWLKKPNLNKAVKEFIRYEKSEILKLKQRIDHHKMVIDSLKNSKK